MRARSARVAGASALILIGLALLLVGIGLRTWWLPPATQSASVGAGASGSAPVTVVDHAVRDLAGGRDVRVSVDADGPVVLALGRASDVDAWVGPAAHTTVSRDGDGLTARTSGGDATVPNPAGADLFVTTERASNQLTWDWTAPESGDWSLLLASDGRAAAPTDVTLTWAGDQSTPWAVPLMLLGGLAVVAGVLVLLIRPRRPRDPGTHESGTRGVGLHGAAAPRPLGTAGAVPGAPVSPLDHAGQDDHDGQDGHASGSTRVRWARPATRIAGLSAVLMLTGVLVPAAAPPVHAAPSSPAGPSSAGPSTTSSPPSSEPAAAPVADGAVVLQPQQVDRIMRSVASTVATADRSRSAAALQPRMTGEALAERTANYRIRAKVTGYRATAAIGAGPVLAQLISTGTGWPRTVVLVTKDDDSTVPQILTLTQQGPRENYRVASAVGLLPGTTFPQAGSDAPAARPLDPARADGLKASPNAAMTTLASVLTAGRTGYTGTVSKNAFVDQILAGQTAAVKANRDARITSRHTADAKQTRVLQTSDGGALVLGTLRNAVTVIPREKGGAITLRSELATLAGATESRTSVDIVYGESVVLYVPAAGSTDTPQVIGAAQELGSVTRR